MKMLQSTVGVVNWLVFVSDQHTSIAKSIVMVFHNAFHALCIHFSMHLKTKFDNNNVYANFILVANTCRESIF